MTQDPHDNLPEPSGATQYEQEWLEPQVQTYDVAGVFARAITTVAVLTGVFGLIMLIWPGATVRVVAILFGLWLILSGVVMLVQALASRGSGLLRVLLGVGGLLSLVIGGVCVVNGDASVRILGLFVVIGWIAHGLAYLVVGIRNKYSPSRSFYLFFGILQLVLAGLVIAWPNETVTVLVRVIAIGLLLTAAFGLWAARQVRKGAAGQGNIVVIEQQ
ncbi:MAG: DUF308 domain-containing protein [Micrococcales bacterium]|nr:DUF308 domain-containing protein [Micrococcales bacterium]